MDPAGVQKLIDNLDRTLKFTLEEEENTPVEECVNLQEVRDDIMAKLVSLRDQVCAFLILSHI